MNIVVGNLALTVAVLGALGALMASLAAARQQSAVALKASKAMLCVHLGGLVFASLMLLRALVHSDFSVGYVAHYTERALPMGYKLAAFWAGQAGSLLLWALILGVMAVLAAWMSGRGQALGEQSGVVATLAAVCGFFAGMMLFVADANPFTASLVVPEDGQGLNPMLQDPVMLAHPPALFLGYAGYTIPFAMMVGAMLSGRRDNQWVVTMRRWSIFSWLTLTVGIVLGAEWAYVELGWGGYWAWDPVENASLLPWLTGTALLHSVMVQQHRGMFKSWNVMLTAVTFLLCIFGTYLTRSGVIQSVHSFGTSPIGTWFLLFLAAGLVFSLGILVGRRQLLRPEQPLEELLGKEGAFLATNILLVLMTVMTTLGTIFPLLSSAVGAQQVNVGPKFYNHVVLPMGIALAAVMALGPALVYGVGAGRRLGRSLLIPAAGASLVAVVAIVLGLRSIWALVCVAVVSLGVLNVLVDLGRSVWLRIGSGENPLLALWRLLDGNHRRYGGQVVHLGVLMAVAGIAGSSLFVQKQVFTVKSGDTIQFADRSLKVAAIRDVDSATFAGLEAQVEVTEASGRQLTLRPQIQNYKRWAKLNEGIEDESKRRQQTHTEAAIDWTWRGDLYLTVLGYHPRDGLTLQAAYNPLVLWIWIGGIVMTLGAIVCMVPRLGGSGVPAEQVLPMEPPSQKVRAGRGQARGGPAVAVGQ